MSEGELLQIEKSRKLDISEDIYFEIIRKKTATLIASCAAAGSKSAGADDATVSKMKQFGESLGIAFQIKDDLFDFNPNGNTGKPIGNDIKERKMTLPLIYSLKNCTTNNKRKILSIIKKKKKKPGKIKEVFDFVETNNGIAYSTKMMNEYKDKAMVILNTFPDSEAKNALIKLVDYTIMRNK